jgi:hypothetical protein
MSDIRIARDDLCPYLEDMGITEKIQRYAARNYSDDEIRILIADWCDLPGITWPQVNQVVADLLGAGKLPGVELSGSNNPIAIQRLDKPSGIGCNGVNIWCTPPAGPYTMRWMINGLLKLTQSNYYTTDLASVGAVPGDIAQMCQVSTDGIVGWWARIAVP